MARKINPFLEEELPPFGGFPSDFLAFFKELKANNNREWFTENKPRFEQSVKEPMDLLLRSLGRKLAEFDSEILIDPKTAPYRIYRDVRFSADKSPYKTHYGASFTLRDRDRKTDAGFYFHVTDTEIIVAGGHYTPQSDQLKKLRLALSLKYKEFEALLNEAKFKKHFGGLKGEQASRVPQGFEKDHPAAELLKHKQFMCWKDYPPKSAVKPNFLDTLADDFAAMTPFVKWLLKHS